MRRILLGGRPLLLLPALGVRGGGPRVSPAEVIVARAAALPVDPGDAAWTGAPIHPAALVLQDMVDPRLLEASTPQVRVQALTDGARVAFRLAWDDADRGRPRGAGAFPGRVRGAAPREDRARRSGAADGGVGATASRSRTGAPRGRPPSTAGRTRSRSSSPNADVGHYPFEAASLAPGSPEQQAMALRYAPAQAPRQPDGGAEASPRCRTSSRRPRHDPSRRRWDLGGPRARNCEGMASRDLPSVARGARPRREHRSLSRSGGDPTVSRERVRCDRPGFRSRWRGRDDRKVASRCRARGTRGGTAEWRLLGLLFERPRHGWHEGCTPSRARRAAATERDGPRRGSATEGNYLSGSAPAAPYRLERRPTRGWRIRPGSSPISAASTGRSPFGRKRRIRPTTSRSRPDSSVT